MGKLFQESGSNSQQRRQEADKLCELLRPYIEDTLTQKESCFVEQMMDDLEPVSPKQLFWLRDLRDKYVLG